MEASELTAVVVLPMAEETTQPTFPDMTQGIDYAKYTVEGNCCCFFRDVQIQRTRVEARFAESPTSSLVCSCTS